MPLEVGRKDVCLVWRCGKPLRDENGNPLGARGMCWQHLKEAQRSGELLPFERPPRPLCRVCGKPVQRYARARLCNKHYAKQNRQTSPQRQVRLARDRERKRWNKQAKDSATSAMV